ncbi:hypothetical protein BD779DRAFT_1443159, partial [Infundibulicybe gibba]
MTNEPPTQENQGSLKIWQQNINKSLVGQHDLLNSAGKTYDIVAIQEPHIDFLGNTRANPHWDPVRPTGWRDRPKETRSVMLINKKINTNSWCPITIDSQDVTGIQMHGNFGTIRIINIY